MGTLDTLQFPEQSTLILDSLPFPLEAFGMQAKLSTI